MGLSAKSERFPCPVCSGALGVRQSKKHKPYVVCDSCGVQMFIRNRPGIRRFEELVARAEDGNALDRIAKLERRYLRECPGCGRKFWVEQELVQTDWVNGSFLGFRCPNKDCEEVVPWEKRKCGSR